MKSPSTRYLAASLPVLFLLSTALALTVLHPFGTEPRQNADGLSIAAPADTARERQRIRDSVYNASVAAADRYYNQKDYVKCLAELTKAQKNRANDHSLDARMAEVKKLAATQQDQNEQVKKSMASGDAYFRAKDYLNAKAAYQVAVSLAPDDAAAKEKLRQTMDLLRSQKAQNTLFDVAVAGADKLFQAGEYDKARVEYDKATKMLPTDPYPKNKINEIIKIQVDLKVKGEEYAAAIARADKFFQQKNLQDALIDYKKASVIKPEEKYPQDRIAELTKLIAAAKERDEAYKKAIALGDQAFDAVNYKDAVTAYRNALTIKPEEAYPKGRIKEIEGIIASIADAQSRYDKAINLADSLYIEKKYVPARENYVAALSAKPKESYPKEMISKCESMLSGQEAAELNKEENYKTAVAEGDRALANKLYEAAKSDYNRALAIKPNEAYPKTKIAEADKLIAAEAKVKAADARYANAIGKADSLFMAGAYLPSKNEFQAASNMKPEEVYPKNRIVEINTIIYKLEQQKQADLAYAAQIEKADKLLAEKNYTQAKAEYEKALAMKAGEAYPTGKLAEISRILEDQAAALRSLDENYKVLIAAGDKHLGEKSYETARDEYTRASALKPGEAYPKQKLDEITGLLAAIAAAKALGEQYAQSIAAADKLFDSKSLEAAKTEYTKASTLKPAEQYPKDRIAAIDKTLAGIAANKALEDQYAGIIAGADKLLADQSFEAAKAEYSKALGLKPEEKYPKAKISEIEKKLADFAALKALDDKYGALVAEGDRLLAEKTYDAARDSYNKALKVKPAEQYPKDKLAVIDQALAALAAARSLDENYKAAIASGDRRFTNKDYETAKGDYTRASELKPEEAYPKQKIGEIDKLLADLAAAQALDAQYTAAISSADKSFSTKMYEDARRDYTTASGLKPGEQYPKGRLAEIDKLLSGIAAAKALDDQYSGIIAAADKLLADQSFEAAKAEYTKASGVKPEEKYPKARIAEIDKKLGELAAAKALDDKYSALVAEGDKLLGAKSYDLAKDNYSKALKVKPAEQYPKDKLLEIDQALAAIAAARSLDENYKAAIASGDRRFGEKNYESAKSDYLRATELKPGEAYPKQKAAEIDKLLADIAAAKALDEQYTAAIATADKSFAAKSYDDARRDYSTASGLKPAEQYPKGRLAEIEKLLAGIAAAKALDEQYAGIIAGADKLLADKSFTEAKAEYAKASQLKPAEKYPKDKIAEADKALADIAAAKALDEQYAGILTGADKLLAAKTYDAAKAEYLKASKLKPAEQLPKDKVAEIDRILADLAAAKKLDEQYAAAVAEGDRLLTAKSYEAARTSYTKASELKPDQEYPKTKLAAIETTLGGIARQKALDEEYAATIAGADKLLAEKSYQPARDAYVKAGELKPAAEYPKTKIKEIDLALAEIARLKAIDDKYAAAVTGADRLLAEKSYEQARTAYTDAGKIKPLEKYPQEKITEINGILTEMSRLKSIDDQYKAAITKADQFLADKNYEFAKTNYSEASRLKPDEQYPKDKIAQLDGILADLKAKEDAYRTSVATADQLFTEKKFNEARAEYENALSIKPGAAYPKEKIADINKALEELLGKQKYYDNLIADADAAFRDKDLGKARDTYQQALNVFPAQPYPKSQVTLITARIDSLYRANKSLYDKAVADGDRYYNTFEFDKAIDAYTDAANYLPMEKYPREMIVKIRRTLAENAIADVLNSTVVIKSNDEKQFSFTPVNIASRKNNFVYIKIKNLSGKPFNVLVRYGKDKQSNGGVVMRNLNPDGKLNERLVSVRDQDTWYREDNNWISLYPQGGDVEVSFIQVSRAK